MPSSTDVGPITGGVDRVVPHLAAMAHRRHGLMGVWEPSQHSAQVARQEPQLVEQLRQALDDYRSEDCMGSPYAVQRYEVAEQVGGRGRLQACGQRAEELNRKELPKEQEMAAILLSRGDEVHRTAGKAFSAV